MRVLTWLLENSKAAILICLSNLEGFLEKLCAQSCFTQHTVMY